ncbi:siderophore ABC transporter substrate-binding protein [Vibrio nitrifigilis]|uniref:Siderophore ABC transporter substrate-binding protein n=1 Tax=Vibrio nitrifigilis TaxID=2789781 RepID=A0ABS0GK22_9VIBR|nr:siderophore ABC transporter substrate-binding protein [Vibrio nitrifigilis]MBF9002778.1 siderophore ABC transporter substrate-binding protein [Vibrio nitrifigilis]
MKASTSVAILGLLAAFSSQASTVTIQHELGKTTLEQQPKRVVVIGIGALDAIDAFGIKPVAVSKVGFMPDFLKKYQGEQYGSAGSLFDPDFEKIYSEKPDLIIIGPRAAKAYKELSDIAPTIVFGNVDTTDYWKNTQQQWRNLGKIFAIEPKVDAKIAQLDKEFKQIKAYNQAHHEDAMTVLSTGGNVSTFGEKSRFSSVYEDFGFTPTVKVKQSNRHGDLISYEYIREHNPQTLFIIDRDKLVNKGKSHTHEYFENALVKETDAYKHHRVTYLNLNAWYLGVAGVHATEQMIADMQQVVSVK